jgi:hypothetical protein
MMIVFRKFKILVIIMGMILVIVAGLQIYCAIAVNNDDFRKKMNDYFLDNFNKAIKFDDVKVYFWGNVSLSNFQMSKSADFNDTTPLIRCENASISISPFDLILRKITVKKIDIKGGEINILKQVGDDIDSIVDIFRSFNTSESTNSQSNEMTIAFEEVALNIKMGFDGDYLQIKAKDLAGLISKKGRKIKWSYACKILPNDEKKRNLGSLNGNGFIDVTWKGDRYGEIINECEEIDLSNYSPIAARYLGKTFHVDGSGKVKLALAFYKNSISSKWEIAIDDLNILEDKKIIMSVKSFSGNCIVDIISNKKIRVNSFQLTDGNIEMSGSVVCEWKKGNKSLNISYEMKKFDLDDFASSYMVSKDINIDGNAESVGNIYCDITNGILDLCIDTINVRLKKASWKTNTKRELTMVQGDTGVRIDDNMLNINSIGTLDGSRYTIKMKTDIWRFKPLSSTTVLEGYWENIDSCYIAEILYKSASRIIEDAYNDRKKGYEEIRFLDTAAGDIVTHNDFIIKSDFEKITIGSDKGAIKKTGFSVSLKQGLLKGGIETGDLLGGTMRITFDGMFKTDFPQFAIDGNVENVDLSRLVKSTAGNGMDSGSLSMTMKYNINGNRIAHIIDNGIMDMEINVKDMILGKSSYLKSITEYITKSKMDERMVPLKINTGNIIYHQANGNGYIQRFSISGDMIGMNGFGKYLYDTGISIHGECMLKKTEGPVMNAPFGIMGAFAKPELAVGKIFDKKSDRFVLYHID